MATPTQKSQSLSSSVRSFLTCSVTLWFSVSLASSTLSSVFLLSSTTTPFAFTIPLSFLSAALHILIFLSHHRLRALMEVLKHKPFLDAVITFPLIVSAVSLSGFPNTHSVSGLLFSIFFTVQVLAVIQIIRPAFVSSLSLYFISKVAVDRAADLYGFWGSFFMYGFTAGVVGLNYWLDEAIKEDSNHKMLQVTDDDNKLPPTFTTSD